MFPMVGRDWKHQIFGRLFNITNILKLLTKFYFLQIMELNKNHREALLNELIKAKDRLELGKSIGKSELYQKTTQEFKDFRDIEIFLLQEKIKLIESSLIANEIDF